MPLRAASSARLVAVPGSPFFFFALVLRGFFALRTLSRALLRALSCAATTLRWTQSGHHSSSGGLVRMIEKSPGSAAPHIELPFFEISWSGATPLSTSSATAKRRFRSRTLLVLATEPLRLTMRSSPRYNFEIGWRPIIQVYVKGPTSTSRIHSPETCWQLPNTPPQLRHGKYTPDGRQVVRNVMRQTKSPRGFPDIVTRGL